MRHANHNIYFRGINCCKSEPYGDHYVKSFCRTGFKNANSSKKYVKILQYIADHDGCKRVDILRDVLGIDVEKKDPWYKGKLANRGYYCIVFSQLLYIDVIDYDKNYRYHITKAGNKVLKNAYLNDMKNIVLKQK